MTGVSSDHQGVPRDHHLRPHVGRPLSPLSVHGGPGRSPGTYRWHCAPIRQTVTPPHSDNKLAVSPLRCSRPPGVKQVSHRTSGPIESVIHAQQHENLARIPFSPDLTYWPVSDSILSQHQEETQHSRVCFLFLFLS